LISIGVFVFFYYLSNNNGTVVPTRYQSLIEMVIYLPIYNMVKENIPAEGHRYFPFLLTLFAFLLIINLVGIIPYTFAPTSHGAISFGLSISVFLGCNLIAYRKHGLDYIAHFFPSGVPFALAPLLIGIEIISNFIRPVSLGLRLAANITAGHLLLTILSSFIFKMMCMGGGIAVASLIPLFIVFFITVLEIAVAMIQAFVFCLLTSLFLSEAFELH
jgi:ATP synthase subunit 6